MSSSFEEPVLAADIERVRRFDRFCERRIRELQDRSLVTDYSWAMLKVLRELGNVEDGRSAAWLRGRLDLDKGYLCRTLKTLGAYGYVAVGPSTLDRRHRDFTLTARGRDVFRGMEKFHRDDVRRMLGPLPERQRRRLARALRTIEKVLSRSALDNLREHWLGPRMRARYRMRRIRSPAASAPSPPTART